MVAAMVAHDDFERRDSCVGKMGDPSVVVAVSPVLLFVTGLDCRIGPLLGDFSCYPNIDKDVVKALTGRMRVGPF